MRMTDTHVYFLGGPFSNWHPSLYTAPLMPGGVEFEFNCSEQYMMAFKAMLMQDFDSLEGIMKIQPEGGNVEYFRTSRRGKFNDVPKRQKAAGRAVGRDSGKWDQKLWDDNCMLGVFLACFFKFTSDPKLSETLLATGERILVEGASYDREWGVGIDWADPRIEDEANWLGKNRLGITLMTVREVLRSGVDGFDPFVRAYREAA